MISIKFSSDDDADFKPKMKGEIFRGDRGNKTREFKTKLKYVLNNMDVGKEWVYSAVLKENFCVLPIPVQNVNVGNILIGQTDETHWKIHTTYWTYAFGQELLSHSTVEISRLNEHGGSVIKEEIKYGCPFLCNLFCYMEATAQHNEIFNHLRYILDNK